MPDKDGYPTKEELVKIKEWDPKDLDGLMEYLMQDELWHFGDWGITQNSDGGYQLHTGGWSGNEEIIGTMQENVMFWLINWQESRRGGHYIFKSVMRES
jgi:hypothetical protein